MTVDTVEGFPLFRDFPNVNHAAATTYYYVWSVGAQTSAAVAGLTLLRGLPQLHLSIGDTITIYDTATISALDTCEIVLHGWELTEESLLRPELRLQKRGLLPT